MEPPRSYKDVQKLTGRLAALSRFISKSAFEELKQYLGSPKLLTKPEEGEELQEYLAVSEGAARTHSDDPRPSPGMIHPRERDVTRGQGKVLTPIGLRQNPAHQVVFRQ
ncbi:hypothetical protein LIER_37718 [Lithospermum erythrorhizon]|uniref:Uncharacterized protein n=1 Tax=Lithospermum erythrorhizon TaxID=34254 RepID=A0AAV3PQ35_LITER